MQQIIKSKITAGEIANRKSELPTSLARRVPVVYQAAFLAAKEILDKNPAKPEGNSSPPAIICVSALGCLNETISFVDKLDETSFGSPKDFVFSVHNSLGGILSKEFSITGANITLTDTNFEKAIEIAEILDERIILIVEFDDKNAFAEKVFEKCGKTSTEEPFAAAFLYAK
jgi:hypothetical protein